MTGLFISSGKFHFPLVNVHTVRAFLDSTSNIVNWLYHNFQCQHAKVTWIKGMAVQNYKVSLDLMDLMIFKCNRFPSRVNVQWMSCDKKGCGITVFLDPLFEEKKAHHWDHRDLTLSGTKVTFAWSDTGHAWTRILIASRAWRSCETYGPHNLFNDFVLFCGWVFWQTIVTLLDPRSWDGWVFSKSSVLQKWEENKMFETNLLESAERPGVASAWFRCWHWKGRRIIYVHVWLWVANSKRAPCTTFVFLLKWHTFLLPHLRIRFFKSLS